MQQSINSLIWRLCGTWINSLIKTHGGVMMILKTWWSNLPPNSDTFKKIGCFYHSWKQNYHHKIYFVLPFMWFTKNKFPMQSKAAESSKFLLIYDMDKLLEVVIWQGCRRSKTTTINTVTHSTYTTEGTVQASQNGPAFLLYIQCISPSNTFPKSQDGTWSWSNPHCWWSCPTLYTDRATYIIGLKKL